MVPDLKAIMQRFVRHTNTKQRAATTPREIIMESLNLGSAKSQSVPLDQSRLSGRSPLGGVFKNIAYQELRDSRQTEMRNALSGGRNPERIDI